MGKRSHASTHHPAPRHNAPVPGRSPRGPRPRAASLGPFVPKIPRFAVADRGERRTQCHGDAGGRADSSGGVCGIGGGARGSAGKHPFGGVSKGVACHCALSGGESTAGSLSPAPSPLGPGAPLSSCPFLHFFPLSRSPPHPPGSSRDLSAPQPGCCNCSRAPRPATSSPVTPSFHNPAASSGLYQPETLSAAVRGGLGKAEDSLSSGAPEMEAFTSRAGGILLLHGVSVSDTPHLATGSQPLSLPAPAMPLASPVFLGADKQAANDLHCSPQTPKGPEPGSQIA